MVGTVRFAALMFAVFVALASPALAAKLSIKGDVTYSEKVKLPAGATLEIGLVDLATPDVPKVAATAAIADRGKIPLTFTLAFDDKVLVASHSYGVTVAITSAGQVWFKTTAPYPFDPKTPDAPLHIKAAFAGTIQKAPKSAAPETAAPTGIVGVTWQADTIGGQPVISATSPTLSIDAEMRAGGRGGCNSWYSQVQLLDQSLVFSAIAATRMACLSDQQNAQEQAFFDALTATRFWRIDGEELILSDEGGSELATFSRAKY